MRHDPLRRLRRSLPGEAIGEEGTLGGRLRDRDVEPRADRIPNRDQRPCHALVLRATGRTVEPRPNAPLLIRLVRSPYALATVRGVRRTYLAPAEVVSRVDWHRELVDALALRVRVRSTRVAGDRPRPFHTRPSRWILAPGDDR